MANDIRLNGTKSGSKILDIKCQGSIHALFLKIGLGFVFLLFAYVLNVIDFIKTFENGIEGTSNLIHHLKTLQVNKEHLMRSHISFFAFLIWSGFFTKKIYKLKFVMSLLTCIIATGIYTAVYFTSTLFS